MKTTKKYICILAVAAVAVIFSLNGKTVLTSVMHSLELCYSSVIPALFPFFVLSEFLVAILASTGANPTVYAFICGLLTGFPTGTKNVCTLYKNDVIDKKTAVSLLHCTVNASPAYIVSFIGICMIGSRAIGFILFTAQTVCALMCALSFRAFTKIHKKAHGVIDLTSVATSSITGSVTSCLYVCGYIVFMGVIADIALVYGLDAALSRLLFFIPSDIVKPTVIGAIEISRGISLIDFTSKHSILTASLILGFSGISVVMQCISCVNAVSLPYSPIIKCKLIYAFIMPCITYFLTKAVPITFSKHSGAFIPLIFAIFLLFIGVFIYIIFDKSYKRLYNKEKTIGDKK